MRDIVRVIRIAGHDQGPPADQGAEGARQRADDLAREFEPSATAIRRWVERADLDEGRRAGGPTTVERKEVRDSSVNCAG